MSSKSFIVFLTLSLSTFTHATSAAPGRDAVSLNGVWESAVAETLESVADNLEWKPFNVPGEARSIRGEKRWFKTTFDLPADWRGRRAYIEYDGVKWNSVHFVNGERVGAHFRGYDPFEIDVTNAVEFGERNELIVGCCDWQGTFTEPVEIPEDVSGNVARGYPHNVGLAPLGGRCYQYGLWGDCRLVAVSPTRISDVTIRTSVREQTLSVILEIQNAGDADVEVTVGGRVDQTADIVLSEHQLVLAPGQRTVQRWTIAWANPKLWGLDDPHLYNLNLKLRIGDVVVDSRTERFGFREFWREGPYFFLNGTRTLLRSSAMWPLSPPDKQAAAEHLRKMKAINVICFRTHTQPWRSYWYEAADEVGMLMIPEGPVFNDDNIYRLEDQRFWDNYAADLKGMVKRLKNHPSIVMWSMENEFYGARMNERAKSMKDLVRMGKLMREYDPTRPFMYESDGDPGGVADVIGIHYPHEPPAHYLFPNTCYWMDEPKRASHWFAEDPKAWKWEKKKPLYIGEYLWYPSATPAAYSVFLGDQAYRDYYRGAREAIAQAWSLQTRAYRYYRVSGLCPWTVGGTDLDPRTHPGVAAQMESMRPLAAFVKEYDSRFYSGATIRRTLHIMNDTFTAGKVKVNWKLALTGTPELRAHSLAYQERLTRLYVRCESLGENAPSPKTHLHSPYEPDGEKAFAMKPADMLVYELTLKIPEVNKRTDAVFIVRAELEGETPFEDVIPCSLFPRPRISAPKRKLGIFKNDLASRRLLRSAGIGFVELDSSDIVSTGAEILVVSSSASIGGAAEGTAKVDRQTLVAGVPDTAGSVIRGFVEGGGRLLFLGQRSSDATHTKGLRGVGRIRFLNRQSTMTFPLWPSHPLLRDVRADDLRFWATDNIVADAHVDRFASGAQAVLVSGSSSGINISPLAVVRIGKGVAVACGLRMADAFNVEPAAARIFANILDYLDNYRADDRRIVYIGPDNNLARGLEKLQLGIERVESPQSVSPTNTRLALVNGALDRATASYLIDSFVKDGGELWWHRPDPDSFERVMKAIDSPSRILSANGPVTLMEDDFTCGLAQADLYWLGKRPKGQVSWTRTPLDPGIIDSEVGARYGLNTSKARAFRCTEMKTSGSEWNRPSEGGMILASNGSLTAQVDCGRGGWSIVGVRSKGSPAAGGWPRVVISIGRNKIGALTIDSRNWRDYTLAGEIPAGEQEAQITFINDFNAQGEDRNVWLSHLYIQPTKKDPRECVPRAAPAALASARIGEGTLIIDTIKWDETTPLFGRGRPFVTSLLLKLGAAPTAWPISSVEAEQLEYDKTAYNRPQGDILALANAGGIHTKILCTEQGRYRLSVAARGSKAANEWPILAVRLDGEDIGRLNVESAIITNFYLPIDLTVGSHKLDVSFINDFYQLPEDRNCFIDKIEIWKGEE